MKRERWGCSSDGLGALCIQTVRQSTDAGAGKLLALVSRNWVARPHRDPLLVVVGSSGARISHQCMRAEKPLRSKRARALHQLLSLVAKLKLLSAELANQCGLNVGIGIRAGVSAADVYRVGVIARIIADVWTRGGCAASIMRRGRVAVTTSCHCGRRGCSDRAGKQQPEHQADHSGPAANSRV
jgi:hypothetical protein